MKLGKSRIRNRLLLCILVPVVAVFAVSRLSMSLIIRPYLEELLVDRSAYMGERRIDQFESLQSQLYSTAQSLIGNETIQSSLSGAGLGRAEYVLREILRTYVFDDILNITYVSSDLDRVYHAYQAESATSRALALIADANLDDTYARSVWLVPAEGAGEGQFFVLQKLRHLTIDVEPGYLVYHVRLQPLEQLVDTAAESERVFLLDHEGAVIFPHTGGGDLPVAEMLAAGGAVQANTLAVTLENRLLLSHFADRKTGWRIVSFADYEDVMGRYNGIMVLITGITVVMVAASTALIFSLTLHYTRPIGVITGALRSFQHGRFRERIDPRLPDEFADIGDTFNHMADRIDTLIRDVEKGREELKTAELESLMYQINPHFIYNTLNNLYMLARMNGQQQLAGLIDSLSRFLRISLSKGSSMIPVREEIEHVSSYLAIQQTRYGSLFDYTADVALEVSQAMVLKFILQPLAENAINHGFAGMERGGWIAVRAWGEGGAIHLEVRDNGRGIEPVALERLNAAGDLAPGELKDLFPGQEGGYGIGNVIARLRLYYGERYRLRCENLAPGARCVITVWGESYEPRNNFT